MFSFSPHTTILIHFSLLILLSSISSSSSSSSGNASTIYEALKNHGLPMGLFPQGVKDFSVEENGSFWVHLKEPCNAKFENELHYDRNVSGNLSYGMIDGLTGLEAQDLFLWFPVKSIRVDVPTSGVIYFDVGPASKQLSLSLFEIPPECVAVRSQQTLLQGKFGRLRYKLDQGTSGRDVL